MLATPFTDAASDDLDARIDHFAAAGGEARAREDFRRAADCYAAALRLAPFSREPGRAEDLWRRQRDCWEQVVDRSGERIAIPYEGTALAGNCTWVPDYVRVRTREVP